MANTITVTKMASTTEQLNIVIAETIESLENDGYVITEVSDTREILKSCTIQKKKGYAESEEETELYNYIFAKDVIGIKEEL
ncbi:MAG: hypothetical protein IKF29_00540 [Oceanobacillus sp.]|nr:hypothetical protein [Oceanobacillus sp.]